MNYLLIKHQDIIHRVKLDDICYIASIPDASHMIRIVTVDREYKLFGKLQDFQAQAGSILTRCSRGLLVHPDHVTSIAPKTRTLYFDNDQHDSQTISRAYLREFLRIWKQ